MPWVLSPLVKAVSPVSPRPIMCALYSTTQPDNHHQFGLGVTGDTALNRGDRTQGIGNFLQGRGAGDSTVWVGYVGPFGENGEEVGRYTHWVHLSDQGEAI